MRSKISQKNTNLNLNENITSTDRANCHPGSCLCLASSVICPIPLNYSIEKFMDDKGHREPQTLEAIFNKNLKNNKV